MADIHWTTGPPPRIDFGPPVLVIADCIAAATVCMCGSKEKIGKGRKRDNVEVYSQEHFMIGTGATWHPLSFVRLHGDSGRQGP